MTDKDSASIDTASEAKSIPNFISGMAGERVLLSELMKEPEIAARMNIINDEMTRFIQSFEGEPKILYDAAKHLVRAGGKRLRSLVTILSCEAVGGNPNDIVPFAVAVELVQTASLIHDDIIDDDILRRGVETTHRRFGSRVAVLAGDLLVAHAIRLIGNLANPALLKLVGRGGILLCEGEVSDMLMGKMDPAGLTVEDYLAMIKRKTAALMRVSAGVGALIGGGTSDEREALMNYAEAIGMAFQIRDDVLNLTAPQDVTGKSMLTDLEWERSNIVLVHCLETAAPLLKEQCMEALNHGELEEVLRIMGITGSFCYATSLAQEFAAQAKEAIQPHEFPIQLLLEKVADFVVVRGH